MPPLGYALAFLIGGTLGMLGAGGSILTVPVFVYVLGYDPKLAIVMSLPVVSVTSAVGAAGYWRTGTVHLARALPFGVVTMAGAFTGARLSVFLSGRTQLVVFAFALLAAAGSMLRGRDEVATHGVHPAPLPASRLVLLATGFLTGMLTGLVGVGGGFLIVPVLVGVARMGMREAVGTSLTVIALSTGAALTGHRDLGRVPFDEVLVFTAVAIAGIVVGGRIATRVSVVVLRRAFAILLLGVAAFVLSGGRALP